MPLEIREHSPGPASAEHFSQVLREDPTARTALERAVAETGTGEEGWQALEGVFNARPVALALLHESPEGWSLHCLVVHPATRGRGVGTDMIREALRRQPSLALPDSLASLAARAGSSG